MHAYCVFFLTRDSFNNNNNTPINTKRIIIYIYIHIDVISFTSDSINVQMFGYKCTSHIKRKSGCKREDEQRKIWWPKLYSITVKLLFCWYEIYTYTGRPHSKQLWAFETGKSFWWVLILKKSDGNFVGRPIHTVWWCEQSASENKSETKKKATARAFLNSINKRLLLCIAIVWHLWFSTILHILHLSIPIRFYCYWFGGCISFFVVHKIVWKHIKSSPLKCKA